MSISHFEQPVKCGKRFRLADASDSTDCPLAAVGLPVGTLEPARCMARSKPTRKTQQPPKKSWSLVMP
eukprot:scaffold84520_cov66-Phaeocystis_antarctica.AAC.1